MHFGPWEIAAFGGLWVSAVMLALDVGLRMSPPVRERLGALDRFTATGLWAFTPLALLTISGIIFLADRLTLLPVHDLDAGVATTWQFVAPLLLLMLVAVIWSNSTREERGRQARTNRCGAPGGAGSAADRLSYSVG